MTAITPDSAAMPDARLPIDQDPPCVCGHRKSEHYHGGACNAVVTVNTADYSPAEICNCWMFKESDDAPLPSRLDSAAYLLRAAVDDSHPIYSWDIDELKAWTEQVREWLAGDSK